MVRCAGSHSLGSPLSGKAEYRKDALFRFPDRPVDEGWESAQAALARIFYAMDRLMADANGRHLIAVSHGTVLSLYLAELHGRKRVALVIQGFGVWSKATT